MNSLFQIALGTITGDSHHRIFQNRQDSVNYYSGKKNIIGIVCDGCGSAKQSEFGAQFSSAWITRHLAHALNRAKVSSESDVEKLLENCRRHLLSKICRMTSLFGHNSRQTILNYFLFSITGILITPDITATFCAGDGVSMINSEFKKIGPFPENIPPYPTYSLLHDIREKFPFERLKFNICASIQTPNLQHAMVGSDGVNDLINCSEICFPGKKRVVGKIDQIWNNDLYFKNSDALRRFLFRLNNTCISEKQGKIRKSKGLLPDDTTLFVVRRKREH